MDKEKTCATCRYYLQHYIRRQTYFMKIATGHCVCPEKEEAYPRKPRALLDNCPYWQPAECELPELKKSIGEYLAEVERRLDMIRSILAPYTEEKER